MTGNDSTSTTGMTSEASTTEDTTASGTSDADSFGALAAEWNEAIVANDAEAIGRFAEPDWVFVGENGIFSGAQFLDSVAEGRVTHDFMTSDVHEVRIYGDVAVVTARVHNSGTFEGNPFQLDEWSTDVFVRRADGWRCAVTHLTPAAAPSPPPDDP
jgi:ketosteroid isomerase-like protein